MHDPIPCSEIKHITFEEMSQEEEVEDYIPEHWDEDKHLNDYATDDFKQAIEEHYLSEHLELKRMGLSDVQAEGVINHVE